MSIFNTGILQLTSTTVTSFSETSTALANVLLDLTVDSEPILPLGKEWAQNCPNIHFWSGFAKRVLEK